MHDAALRSSPDDGDEVEEEETTAAVSGNFDGKGFAGYLAPYALALFASIGVTWAFVKFVLLDY